MLRKASRVASLRSLGASVFFLVCGCAVTPYEQSFRCPLASDFGSCTDVAGAYTDAVAGHAPRDAELEKGSARAVSRSSRQRRGHGDADGAQRDSAPRLSTPYVAPPALLRTWIRSYRDPDRALFEARYAFHLAGDSTITGADNVQAASLSTPSSVLPLPTAAR